MDIHDSCRISTYELNLHFWAGHKQKKKKRGQSWMICTKQLSLNTIMSDVHIDISSSLVPTTPINLIIRLENQRALIFRNQIRERSHVKLHRSRLLPRKVQQGCLFHQLGLITLMWEASESLLSLSDCSPPEPFTYLSPDDDTAQHHTSSIIHEIFSRTRPLMAHYVENDSLVVLFSYAWRSRMPDD